MQIGPEQVDLTKVTPAPSIVPDTTSTDVVFSIGHAGKLKTENFNTFAAFITQLSTELAGASGTTTTTTTAPTVDIVAAEGQYDSTTDVLTAQRLVVLLSN